MSACYCDYEPPEFFSKAKPVAAQAHYCGDCGCTIQPGERYERVSGRWDGMFVTCKVCQRCEALRDWVHAHVPCFCWAYGRMLDDARETLGEFAPECPGLLFEAGRLAVKIRRRARADYVLRKTAIKMDPGLRRGDGGEGGA